MTMKLVTRKLAAVAALVAASTSAIAAPVLTADGVAAGFTLSQFAYGFPTTTPFTNGCCGPLGIAFTGPNLVMVSDYPGNIRILTDADGQNAAAIAPTASFGGGNGTGLAESGGFVYLAEQSAGRVVKLTAGGVFVENLISLAGATGLVAGRGATAGKLFVSGNGGIYVIDIATKAGGLLKSGSFDGLTVTADGKTVYAEGGGDIYGYDTQTGVEVFHATSVGNGPDGTELGGGSLLGKIFVNTNGGEVWEVDLAHPNDVGGRTLLVAGGTRGDFVTADPNGSLLFTQTSDIWRLAPQAGGCIGANCGVPEPNSLALLGIALLGVAATRRRKQ